METQRQRLRGGESDTENQRENLRARETCGERFRDTENLRGNLRLAGRDLQIQKLGKETQRYRDSGERLKIWQHGRKSQK